MIDLLPPLAAASASALASLVGAAPRPPPLAANLWRPKLTLTAGSYNTKLDSRERGALAAEGNRRLRRTSDEQVWLRAGERARDERGPT